MMLSNPIVQTRLPETFLELQFFNSRLRRHKSISGSASAVCHRGLDRASRGKTRAGSRHRSQNALNHYRNTENSKSAGMFGNPRCPVGWQGWGVCACVWPCLLSRQGAETLKNGGLVERWVDSEFDVGCQSVSVCLTFRSESVRFDGSAHVLVVWLCGLRHRPS